jgi:hypothetical protein
MVGASRRLRLWTSVAPSRLLMPIDTHIENISRSIGLTQRRSRTGAWRGDPQRLAWRRCDR